MKRFNAYHIYLFITAVSTLAFRTTFTTSALYRFQMAELNPLQLVLLGTVLELSIFIFEIPTGIVADLKSRKTSVIIGYLLIGCGFILEGSFQLFGTILLAQMLWGIGYTFISGAEDAWLADEIGEEKLTAVYLRGTQVRQLVGFVGIFINVALASIALNIPFLIGGTLQILLAIALIFIMPETGFHPTPQANRNNWQKMGHTFQTGMQSIQKRPLLVTILAISFFYGLYSEALDRLWEAHILDNFVIPDIGILDSTVVMFGLINAAIMLLTIGTTEYMRRRSSTFNHAQTVRVLAIFSAVIAFGMIAFGLAAGFMMALAAYTAVTLSRRTMQPLYSAWINRGIEPSVRATVLSTYGQMDAIGQVIGGPLLGGIATRFGLRAALVSAGLLLTPVLGLYGRAAKQTDTSEIRDNPR